MFNVGCNYMSGHGVEKDLIKAAEWFQLASDVGFMHGKLYLPLLGIHSARLYICTCSIYYVILRLYYSYDIL